MTNQPLHDQLDDVNAQIHDLAEYRRESLNEIGTRVISFGLRDQALEDAELECDQLFRQKRELRAAIEHGKPAPSPVTNIAVKRCASPGCNRVVFKGGHCQFHHRQSLRGSVTAAPTHRPWTPADDAHLRELVSAGASANEVALALGRNAGHVRYRMDALRDWAIGSGDGTGAPDAAG